MAGELSINGIEDAVLVGRGGFAEVYRAYEPAFRRTVAVKVLLASATDANVRERFERECQALGLLSDHPNIVTVHGAGFTDTERPYLVMGYLPGGSLQGLVDREGPRPWQEVAATGVKIAGALAQAHEAGILHRDVKPANILLSQYGEPQLADFGIARIAGTDTTASGAITASLAYGAPETLDGERPTPATDVYCLAATLHGLLIGAPPFTSGDADSASAIIRRVLTEPPGELPSDVPVEIGDIVKAGLAKSPADRPSSGRAFGDALRAAQAALGVEPTALLVYDSDSVEAPSEPAAGPATITRDAPVVVTDEGPAQPAGAAASTLGAEPLGAEPADESGAPKRRWALLGGLAAVAAAVVVVAVLALGGDDDDSASTGEASTGTLDQEIPDSGTDTGPVGPIAPTLITPEELCPDGLERPTGWPADGNLTGRDLTEQTFECVDFSGANLRGARLDGSSFIGVDLTGADLTEVSITVPGSEFPVWRGVRVEDATLDGITLHAEVYGVDFTGVDFGAASFSVTLVNTILDRADLSGALGAAPESIPLIALDRVSAVDATFGAVDWAGILSSDLDGADLAGSSIAATQSTLRGATLDGATIRSMGDVDLTDASTAGVTVENPSFAATICPDGSAAADNLGSCDFG